MSVLTTAKMAAPDRADGTPRDLSVTALILAVAGAMWFGWGQAQPPAGWGLPMSIGMVAAVVVAVLAGITARRFRHEATAMEDRRAQRKYGITVGVEVAAIVIGAVGLTLTGHPAYAAPWILLIVGVHFVPLGRLFGSVDLLWSGLALSAVAIAGAVTGAVSVVAPSAVTGAFGGLVLAIAAAASLRRAVRRGRTEG